jgi:hypothetical protein
MKTIRWTIILVVVWVTYIWAAMFASSMYVWVSPLVVGFSILVTLGAFIYIVYNIYQTDDAFERYRDHNLPESKKNKNTGGYHSY